MIWEYRDVSQDPVGVAELFRRQAGSFGNGHSGIDACPFCASMMSTLQHDGQEWHRPPEPKNGWMGHGSMGRDYIAVHACTLCGWWNVFRRCENWRQVKPDALGQFVDYGAVWGVLKTFDVTDVSAPTDELIRYLVVKYGERFNVHPRKFEELVGAIYADAGYAVRVTSYSADRGLDVLVLDGPSDKQVGIQIKRSKGKIEAEAIRSLAGAMILNGIEAGVFVTTSSFRKGARQTAHTYSALGYPIELIDGAAFYDRLRLNRRAMYVDATDPAAPFSRFLKDPEQVRYIHSEQQIFDVGPDPGEGWQLEAAEAEFELRSSGELDEKL
jgi:Restriction endonuclease